MNPLDLVTWAAVVILVVGSSAVFVWFLKDAGEVLRGEDPSAEGAPEQPEDG